MDPLSPNQSWITPKAQVQPTDNKGKGMFAIAPISAGEKVIVFRGEYVNAAEAEKQKDSGKLVMQWDEDLYSVEEPGEDEGYFINHSCDANTWMEDAYTLIAKRDIGKGEEITVDYAVWEANENYISSWECHCGSTNCRRHVTGKDWELPELQELYKHHFSPLLNKRIKNL